MEAMATAAAEAPTWHVTSAEDAAERLEVDVREGLSAADAGRRLERDGPNRLAEATKEPRWKAFLRQFQDLLIIILLIAAVVSFLVTRDVNLTGRPTHRCEPRRSAQRGRQATSATSSRPGHGKGSTSTPARPR